MQGVLFAGSRTVELSEFPEPRPGPGQVVVKIMASGICGSDLRPYRSERRSQFITGHEPCGVVHAVGEGVPPEQARVGDRVIVHHYSGCGTCKHCRVGYTQMCLHGHVVYGFSGHGGNAPYMLCQPLMLVPLPDELSFADGAAVACGTGTAYMALKRLDVSGRDTLAIYGQGPVGLSGDDAGQRDGRAGHRGRRRAGPPRAGARARRGRDGRRLEGGPGRARSGR